MSYKTDVVQDRKNVVADEGKQGSGFKGKGPMVYPVYEGKKHSKAFGTGRAGSRLEKGNGEGFSKPRKFTSYVQAHNNLFMRAEQRGESLRQADSVKDVAEASKMLKGMRNTGIRHKKRCVLMVSHLRFLRLKMWWKTWELVRWLAII